MYFFFKFLQINYLNLEIHRATEYYIVNIIDVVNYLLLYSIIQFN